MPETQHADRSVDALLERAREVAQLAAERTQAIEQQRRLPDDLMAALKDSDLLRIMQPAHWGGYEMDIGTFIRVATELAKGDTSLGWVYCILGIHNFWIGYVDPEIMDANTSQLSLFAHFDKFWDKDVVSKAVLRRPNAMQEVDIHIVGFEPAQALLQASSELSSGIGMILCRGQFFCGNDHLIPGNVLEGFAYNDFGAVRLSRINQVDA